MSAQSLSELWDGSIFRAWDRSDRKLRPNHDIVEVFSSKFYGYDANSVDDVERITFDCVSMNFERQKHQSLQMDELLW